MKTLLSLASIQFFIISVCSATPPFEAKHEIEGIYVISGQLGTDYAYKYGLVVAADQIIELQIIGDEEIRLLEDFEKLTKQNSGSTLLKSKPYPLIQEQIEMNGTIIPHIGFDKTNPTIGTHQETRIFTFSGGLLLKRMTTLKGTVIEDQVTGLRLLK